MRKRTAAQTGNLTSCRALRHAALAPGMIALGVAASGLTALAPTARGAWVPGGTPVCTETHAQYANVRSIATDGAGGAIIAWSDARFSNDDIFAQRIDASGVPRWSTNGVAVCTIHGAQTSPTVLPDAAGGATIFWQDGRDTPRLDIYAQRLDALGIPLWAINGVPLCTSTTERHSSPIAVPDGASGATVTPGYVVAWLNTDLNNGGITGLAVQRVDYLGAGMWASAAAGGVYLVSLAGGRSAPAIATDGTGAAFGPRGAIITWQQYHPTGYDIAARRVSSAGVPQWAADGIPICSGPGSRSNPHIAFVGSGNVIILWEDARNVDQDLYAQKLSITGTVAWLANGLPVCRAQGNQQSPVIVGDGAGGVIATWTDPRGAATAIYAQRIDGNGQPVWTTVDGVPLASGAGDQAFPAVVADGSGGAIVAWTDRRSGEADIYAQRVDGNSNLLWDPNGVPLCQAAGFQDAPAVLRDAGSGALVAWNDPRNGNPDVYADHIAGSGVATAAPPGPAVSSAGLRLALLSSNPARGLVRFALELSATAQVRIDVLDARGRRIRSLPDAGVLGSGRHDLAWDGKDDAAAPVASGIYYVRARAGAAESVERVVQLR
jgi:hypothetical protein